MDTNVRIVVPSRGEGRTTRAASPGDVSLLNLSSVVLGVWILFVLIELFKLYTYIIFILLCI